MRGLEGRDVTRSEDELPLPVFIGPTDAPAVGVVGGGLGADSMVDALRAGGRYRAGVVDGIAIPAMAPCDILIFPERIDPKTYTKDHCWLIWDWVGAGGALVLTHDAVGYRDHPVLFPWVCSGGTAHVENAPVDVIWARPGCVPVGRIMPIYPEHILLQPCIRADMTPIAIDPDTEKPAVMGAAFDTGKVVACGLALGASPKEHEVTLTEGECGLLEAMLDWLLR